MNLLDHNVLSNSVEKWLVALTISIAAAFALNVLSRVFSNADLLASRIRNYKTMRDRRVVFTIGVEYSTPYEKLQRIPPMIKEIIESVDRTRFDRSHFISFGDFSLNFETAYYALIPDFNVYADMQQEINLALLKKFEEEGIVFAFPTRTVHLKQEPMEET